MVWLSAVIFLMFLSVKHAFVISTIGSNVTINLTVPEKGSTCVSLKNGSLLFETDLSTSPKVIIYNDDRISNVSTQSGGNVQFILHNITEKDAGNYVCLDGMKNVIPDCGEWLIVSQTPATPVIQKKSIPNKDGRLVLSCNSSSRSLPKNHNLTMIFSWKRNGDILSSNTTTEFKGSDIRINHLNRSDNGDNFSCQAEEILKSEWSRPFMRILESRTESEDITSEGDITGEEDINGEEDITGKEDITDEEDITEKHHRILLIIFPTVTAIVVVANVFLILLYKGRKGKTREDDDTCETTTEGAVSVHGGASRTVTDVYAVVKKPHMKPEAVSESQRARINNSCDVQELINEDANDVGFESNVNCNCGEQNADGLIYVDLDLPQPTIKDGKPVINRSEQSVLYGQIDFSRTAALASPK